MRPLRSLLGLAAVVALALPAAPAVGVSVDPGEVVDALDGVHWPDGLPPPDQLVPGALPGLEILPPVDTDHLLRPALEAVREAQGVQVPLYLGRFTEGQPRATIDAASQRADQLGVLDLVPAAPAVPRIPAVVPVPNVVDTALDAAFDVRDAYLRTWSSLPWSSIPWEPILRFYNGPPDGLGSAVTPLASDAEATRAAAPDLLGPSLPAAPVPGPATPGSGAPAAAPPASPVQSFGALVPVPAGEVGALAPALAVLGGALAALLLQLPRGLLALYHRVQRHRALEQPTRRRIYESIAARPGVRVGTLQAQLGLNYNTVLRHVRVLQRLGLVEGDASPQRRWFVRDAGLGVQARKAAVAASSPVAASVVRYLAARGPVALATMRAELGLPKSSASTALRRMAHAGLVERRGEGRGLVVALAASAAAPPHGPLTATPAAAARP
jgi:DNA-binding MarR family transcriptional regulator